jgi:hypothetical protein
MDWSMMISLRERATARTRSGDVSPEPPPFLNSKKGGWSGGCPAGWGAGLSPARAATKPMTA